MRIFLFMIILIGSNFTLHSQNEYNNWYFGDYAGITFNTPDKDPIALTDSKIITREGCSSISDSIGNLLFYTNGATVWNREHNIMKNGEGLKGHISSTQSSLIVPFPGNSKKYYLFTLPSLKGNMYYSIISFEDNEDGELVLKNIPLMGPSTEKIGCIQHNNKRDFWIITHKLYTYEYYVFLLDEKGIMKNPVINTIGETERFDHYDKTTGYLKTSPNDQIMATINYDVFPSIEFFSFDNNTGQIGNDFYYSFNIRSSFYGGEFSPDSKKFYALIYDQNNSYKLIQFDFTDINSISYKIVKISNAKKIFSAMQLAPDGKIYFIHPTNRFELSRISKPNEELENCEIEFHTTNVYGITEYGLPNCIPSFLLPGIEYSGADTICLGDTIKISTKFADYYLNPTIRWTGPDGFTSEETEILILNAKEKHSGYYVATVFSENRPQYKDSIYIQVSNNALSPPEIIADGSIEFCQGDSLLLSIDDYFSIEWTSGERSKSIYVKEAGIYGVTVENESGCYSYSEIEVFVKDSLEPIIKGKNSFCEGDSVILSTEIEYQEYKWNTGETSESIVVKEAGTYSVKVSNEECSGTSEKFTVTVNELPEPTIEGSLSVCLGAEVVYKVNIGINDNAVWQLYDGGVIGGDEDSDEVLIKWTKLGTWELYVSVTNENGCFGYETIQITVEESVKPEIIASSPKLCPGIIMTLSADTDYDTYIWYSDNWTDSRLGKQIEIDEIGTYIIEVTQNDCIGLDTIEIEAGTPVVVSILGEDKFCSGRQTTLSADKDYESYEWSTGEDTKEIIITEAGKYLLKVTNDDGCEGTAEFEVTEMEIDLRFVDSDIIDFGEIELGNQIQRTVSIKNNSEYELEYDVRMENNSDFIITSNTSGIIDNDTHKIELIFTPDYPQLYSDNLIIEVTEPCDLTIEKEITGIGYLNSKIWIEDTTIFPDTKDFRIPIRTQVTTDYPISLDLNYEAQIHTDASMMEPDIAYTQSGNDLIFDFQGNHRLSNQPNTLEQIRGWIVFADDKVTPIKINHFEWTDNEYIRIKTDNGNIKMEDICVENLLHIESFQTTQMRISPNPASDRIEINVISQEKGHFTIKIITIEGIEINNQSWEQSTDRLEKKDMNLDLSEISSGAYILILQSPFGVISRQLNVVK